MEWLDCRLVEGHGVASGCAAASPYPAGTIELQRPYFAALGLDLSACFAGTLNLSVAPLEWRLQDPDHCFDHLAWTPLHPPETFSFWQIQLRRLGGRLDGLASVWATTGIVPAWIYLPDPATKVRHFQPPVVLEVLAPPLGPVAVGDRFALGVDPTKVACLDGVRLRGQLLEFLKFRVLAAQSEFFADWRPSPGQPIEPRLVRHWLRGFLPEALALGDADLLATCAKAWDLYGP
jgi:hypothetical protein